MKLLLLILVSALLGGCAAPEPAKPRSSIITRAQVEQFIVKGKTTRADLIREFGRPDTAALMTSAIPGVNPLFLPLEILSYSKIYLQYPTTVSTLKVLVTRQGFVIEYVFGDPEALTEGVPKVSGEKRM